MDALTKDAAGRVFAAVAHPVNDEPTGIFRSDDEGRTWIAAGLAGEHAYSFSVIDDDSIYAGTGSGTYHSSDGGSSWTPVDELPSSVPLSALVKIGDALIAGFTEPRHRALGADDIVDTFYFDLKNVSIKKKDGIEGDVLWGRRNIPPHCKMRQVAADFARTHFGSVPLPVIKDEIPDVITV